MEGDELRRRQYQRQHHSRGYAQEYGGHGVNVPHIQSLRGAPGGDGSDHFRPVQPSTTRPSTSASMSASTGNPHELGNYDFVPSQQYSTSQTQGSHLQYQPEYLQHMQRPRQIPQFTSQLMYNVPQQAHMQAPYDTLSQYQSRQSAAQVLGSQFAAPQYYAPGQAPNVSGPTPMPQHYPTTAYSPSVQYTSADSLGRPTVASSYSATGSEYNPDIETAASGQLEEETNVSTAAYDRYQRAIAAVNDYTSRGYLMKAGESLLDVSQWLSQSADVLRLTKDDEAKYEDRIRFWDSFNLCWLALLQRQKDDTQQLLNSQGRPVQNPNLLPRESLETMGNELVSLCDGLEKHGLVDYQMGVSEQEIIEILSNCIDLVGSDDENDGARTESMIGHTESGSNK